MTQNNCIVDIYWTVRAGERFTISLSESEAWKSLDGYWAYKENSVGWTVEQTTEEVPVALGEVCEGGGHVAELDEDGNELSRLSYTPVKVLWTCPRCGKQHLNDRYDDPVVHASPAPNPSIWFCESGHGIVLVNW
jgi:hypothetical protein